MDHNLREMGVGDLALPKEMQRIGEAFYGRAEAYRVALAAANDEALTQAVVRNIYDGTAPSSGAAGRLAAYIRQAIGQLEAQEASAFLAGRIYLPDPRCCCSS
jgi:cytochrome b pre-mRNA-processing protein 3